MISTIKEIANKWLPRGIYLWFANRYRGLRRLFDYPDTASVGDVDYDAYWKAKAGAMIGHLSTWRRRRAQVFAEIVEPRSRVMSIGVGDGALLHYLIEEKDIIGSGTDISPLMVDFCREQGLDVQLVDANQPPSTYMDERYDYIVLSEIIEHLPDPESLLDNLRPYARRGLLVSIPNTGFITHRLRLLFGKFPLQWIITPGEHLRFWTRSDFHWWADQMKFKLAGEYPYEGAGLLMQVWPALFAAAFVYHLVDAEEG